MVRPNRIWSPEHFHHVVSRGNWRANLFEEDIDFISFLNIIDTSHRSANLEIASYCLMTNHYHLLLRSRTVSLSKVMRNINKSYADYYNKKYEVSGHLFEQRFYSKPIYDLYGLLEVSRYIHMNPVEAAITATPQDYRWSSFPYYYYPKMKKPSYINLTPITELFARTKTLTESEYYCKWMIKKEKLESLHSK